MNGTAFRQPCIRDNEMHCYPLMTTPSSNRRLHPVTLQQAAEDSPTLARLAQLARESGERLKAVELLIPASLRSAVKPGPDRRTRLVPAGGQQRRGRETEAGGPCSANHLRDRGWQVNSIRLKVQISRKVNTLPLGPWIEPIVG